MQGFHSSGMLPITATIVVLALGTTTLWASARWAGFLHTQAYTRTLATCEEARSSQLAWASRIAAGGTPTLDALRGYGRDQHRFELLPPSWAAPSLTSYGVGKAESPDGSDTSRWSDMARVQDGYKWLLNVDHLKRPAEASSQPCVIYSLGGNRQTEFEQAMIDATSCEVFQFDCTVDAASMVPIVARLRQPQRFHFHETCIGVDGESMTFGGRTAKLKSLKTIMTDLGHTRIDLLKIDIEGSEHKAVPAFLSSGVPLPQQLSMELHLFSLIAAENFALVRELVEKGYVLVSREDNAIARFCCSELTFALGCPTDAA